LGGTKIRIKINKTKYGREKRDTLDDKNPSVGGGQVRKDTHPPQSQRQGTDLFVPGRGGPQVPDKNRQEQELVHGDKTNVDMFVVYINCPTWEPVFEGTFDECCDWVEQNKVTNAIIFEKE
jgi:hypothetical protein